MPFVFKIEPSSSESATNATGLEPRGSNTCWLRPRHAKKTTRSLSFLLGLVACFCFSQPQTANANDTPKHRRLKAIPFTEVKFADAFWAPRIQTNRDQCLPHNFQWCEQTGRISNFAKAAGQMPGKFEGIYFNDSDLYKVLEGAAYSLADRRDPDVEKTVDDIIAKVAAAQEENGYLNTYFTLVCPDKKWTNRSKHELYCAGHMMEAAVAHYRATGKRTLLDVACKFADLIDERFGPGNQFPNKPFCEPGHEEIELALVKLYETTGNAKYFDLAKQFVNVRGDASQGGQKGAYAQAHLPVREQSEVVGHAVRAMYLYAGVADVAAYTGDKELIAAMDRIWNDIVRQKLYVTGGVGARHQGEAFGDAYELPNTSAYCETCAAIGLALWAHRLNLMHADAQYADVLERALYNGVLSGVALDGKKFFYVNPLASVGSHHRQPFYGCACCPTNIVRLIPSVPGYVYATGDDGIYVNLFVAGTSKLDWKQPVAIEQQTQYPWDGQVKLTVTPEKPAEFTLHVRIPGWCHSATMTVAGQPVEDLNIQKGYARVTRTWKPGDVVELNLPMPIERIQANPNVVDDRGRVAVQRGPLVYCFEGVDNGPNVARLVLARDPKFVAERADDLLGGITVIKGVDRLGHEIMAIPYYAWDHREPGLMAVWVYQDGKSKNPATDDPSWTGILYRTLDPSTLGPSEPLSLMDLITPSASHCFEGDTVCALSDADQPQSSFSKPRFTWWPKRGTTEWVQYDLAEPRKLSAAEVYWFDDEKQKGRCRAPESWELLYRDGDQWKPVEDASAYGTALDQFNRVTFKPVETTGLRLQVQLKPKLSSGILEWKIQ